MNLTEFIRQNDIKTVDGIDFDNGQDFFKMKEFERKCYRISDIPCLLPETYQVSIFDVRLKGKIRERWDKFQQKTKREFFVDRSFRYPGLYDDFDTITDSVPCGKSIDEAIEGMKSEIEHFLFFKRYQLIDGGRYWLNQDLKRCLVDDGKVVVID